MLENLSVDKKTLTSDDDECAKKRKNPYGPAKDVLACKMITNLKSSIWEHGKGDKRKCFLYLLKMSYLCLSIEGTLHNILNGIEDMCEK